MESLPNEIVLLIFRYLKTYDVVYAFQFLNQRYSCLIEKYRSSLINIDLVNAPTRIYDFYYSLLFESEQFDRTQVEHLKLEGYMLHKFVLDESNFPRLQSLSIIVRRTDELSILLKYFAFFTKIKQLYIRSDVCCCDRILFEENVKQYLFQTDKTQLQSLTFATPPCYSISLQDINFEHCLFTNLTLTVRAMNDFCTILSSIQQLESLRIRVLDSNINEQNPLTIAAPPSNLKHLLFICSHPISYEVIRNIFKTLTPLKRLSFSLIFDLQSGVIDGYRLHSDIFSYLPNLSKIQFEIKSLIAMMSNDLIRSFETPFWSRFAPIGFHSYNHIYTLPFPFHHLNLDQSILKHQRTRKCHQNWRFVRDIDLYDRIPYTNEFLTYLRDEFPRLTSLTLKWKFDLMSSSPSLMTWLSLSTIRRLTIKSTYLQSPEVIKQFLLCLPNCDTLDCDYVLIARTTSYFQAGHVLNDCAKQGKRCSGFFGKSCCSGMKCHSTSGKCVPRGSPTSWLGDRNGK
ncbi:unnamed protein product [Adineta ricciae]|uniref:F-box domain-containing protein n=1 Tax=Adineta ricciae TaxID=249248 RepID=A0A814HU84_ADIRI|nr:unnamed protein product [Adineta ricciae]